ncbi:MAG: sulfotransferase [Candidatus Methanosuratincola sp.]
MNLEPIFIAGPDRSGTTLMYALMASHPEISMVRRTNMWRYFYRRYGDLSHPENLERCLRDMVKYNRMRHLKPDPERIRREFLLGEPTYGNLFSLFHRHHAERAGKRRWGDKSLHTEHYVNEILDEFPAARIIHMTRDPRDRYASVRKRHHQDNPRIGAAVGRWLLSMKRAQQNTKEHPENCLIVRYEELASNPEEISRKVCEFIHEDFSHSMLNLEGAADYQQRGGNSSFNRIEPGTISTRPIGRFREVLSPEEITFIQFFSGDLMKSFGYSLEPVRLSLRQKARYFLFFFPVNFARMLAWMTLTKFQIRRGIKVPSFRLLDEPVASEQKASTG